jgi:ribosome biogenesis GTPase
VKEGVVTKAAGNLYSIECLNGDKHICRIKGKLRTFGLKSTNPVAVGDNVVFEHVPGNDFGSIIEIKERKNYIIRKSTNLSKQYHIIAANVDQAVLVVTIFEPETSTDFIDRYLVSAEAFRIPVIIVFNKFDLYVDAALEKFNNLFGLYKKIGYCCIETSTINGLNLSVVRELLKDKTTVINGNSGTGKSTIINSIYPGLGLKIGNISTYHKTGMHTTSYSEMFKADGGGYIIDTPGIKAFGLSDFYKEELYHFFPEIFKISNNCKFYNCAHIHEPGCAVLKAVEDGTIAQSRYHSYFNLFHDENKKHRL